MKKKVTVCAVLNQNRERIFNIIDEEGYAGLNKCLDTVIDILNKSENVDKASANRCIMTLKNTINRPNVFITTLSTWMTTIKVSL